MGQIISFINMKGGVGKTTLTVNIGYELAYHWNKKVLVVDADPQFNASTYIMSDAEYLKHTEDKSKRTILDIFLPRRHEGISTVKGIKKSAKHGKVSLESCVFHALAPKDGGVLDLIPSTLALMEIETSQRGTENRLKAFLQDKKHAYDYILIDCPPTISIFNQASILASERYIVPLKPDPLSTIGLPLLERWLEETTDTAGMAVEPIGIVFSMVRSTKTMTRIMGELRKVRRDEIFSNSLSQSTDVASSVEKHKAICIYKPTSKCSMEMFEITEEFLQRTEI
jgi:chromosome partitioning protein